MKVRTKGAALGSSAWTVLRSTIYEECKHSDEWCPDFVVHTTTKPWSFSNITIHPILPNSWEAYKNIGLQATYHIHICQSSTGTVQSQEKIHTTLSSQVKNKSHSSSRTRSDLFFSWLTRQFVNKWYLRLTCYNRAIVTSTFNMPYAQAAKITKGRGKTLTEVK